MQKIIAAGGLIINEKHEILFIYRRQFWDLPKGKLDAEESIENCAIREVKEEVGIDNIYIKKFLTKTYHTYFDKWINAEVEKETLWYLMQTSSTEKLKPQLEEDIEEIKWVDEKHLNNYLNKSFATIKKVVEFYLQNKK